MEEGGVEGHHEPASIDVGDAAYFDVCAAEATGSYIERTGDGSDFGFEGEDEINDDEAVGYLDVDDAAETHTD